jgi:hypothetical protein
MNFHFSLAALLKLTVLVAFLSWVCTLDGGGIALLGIGTIALGSCAIALFGYGLMWIFAYILGTPGQRQRERRHETNCLTDGPDVTPQ